MQKIKASAVFFITGVLMVLCALIFNSLNTHTLSDVASHASNAIKRKSDLQNTALASLNDGQIDKSRATFLKLYSKEKIGIYYFNHDSLLYWNNAQIPIEQNVAFFKPGKSLVKLRQGYYLCTRADLKEGVAIALCLVKPLYDLQNNYLNNSFSAWTNIPSDVKIDLTSQQANAVYIGDNLLFSLKGNESTYIKPWAANISFILFVTGFLCGLLSLLLLFKKGVSELAFYSLMGGVFVLRFLMIHFKWPSFFYKSILYDLSVFGNAQSDINFYLGDVLLNAILFLFSAAAFQWHLKADTPVPRRAGGIIGLTVLSAFGVNQFNLGVMSLVENSTLSFDFLDIFNIKFPAFVGVSALALYALSLYVSVRKIISLLDQKIKGLFTFILIVAFICATQKLFLPAATTFEMTWFLGFSLSLFVLIRLNYSQFSLGLGLQILLMSVITSVLLNSYINKKQQQDLALLSQSLSEQRDDILENEFSGLPNRIAADKKLEVLFLFLPAGQKEVQQLLQQKYFGEYFNRYNIEFSLFDENCNPLLSPKQAVLMNEGFFEDQIRYFADSTFVPGLFFVKNYRNNSVYIGKIKLADKRLYVFMEPKQFEELGSFPDLLLDKSQQKQDIFKNFSYATYRSGQSVSRFGPFNYPFFILDSSALAKSNPTFDHLYFQNEEYTQVISQKRKTFADRFTYNSYIFLFFSIISYVCFMIYSFIFTSRLATPSLTRRIQTIIIFLLLVVMSAVGVTSGNLVSGQFEADNKQQLQEKTQIIINELVSQFDSEEFFDESQKEIVNIQLNEYAHLFNTVISIFDKNGYLYNTSQPRLYDLGLAASLANPRALWNLKQNQSSAESVIESAGTLNYFSLYTPLYNSKQKLVGFINLPYFARQSDLVDELSGVISALINVYVILFVVSILAGLILSGYITKPLRLIKQQIANISLGAQNEKIEWESNDEIGRLVAEYNQMLVKLESSANLLAQSERESAWREMAKQVAHEIKNPLTPMKLNLQYLQHLMKNNPEDFKEKFGKASAGIIEQIDSLANIATEFSNFAKLPETSLQTINLSEIISSSVLIFENLKSNVIVNQITENNIFVKGDKDQCLRAFNNILKNAMQALDEINSPIITINATMSHDQVIVTIHDNGCGIPEALKTNIFNPNFTTKTTGSGLGLAMVKNIMQGFGGAIWFESEKDSGTTFYLQFAKI